MLHPAKLPKTLDAARPKAKSKDGLYPFSQTRAHAHCAGRETSAALSFGVLPLCVLSALPLACTLCTMRYRHALKMPVLFLCFLLVASTREQLPWDEASAEAHKRFSLVGSKMAASLPIPALAGTVPQGRDAVSMNAERENDATLEFPSGFKFAGSQISRFRAVDCLAAAAYYEAGADPDDQSAVIQVILNRVRHPLYPSSVCGVVFQGAQGGGTCQFTFACDGSMRRRPSPAAFDSARHVAERALNGYIHAAVGTSTHYHADYVVPYWSSGLAKLATVGRHVFYRFHGRAGRRELTTSAPATIEELPTRHLAYLDSHRSAPDVTDRGEVPELVTVAHLSESGPLSENRMSAPITPAPAARNARVIVADMTQPLGRWALDALNSCGSSEGCVVVAYAGQSGAAAHRRWGVTSQERPVFAFVRDNGTGMQLPFWDCDRFPRSNAAQCLPLGQAALARLLRNR